MSKFRNAVKKHTNRNGRGSHRERRENGEQVEITYALFDCKHCGEDAIVSKADFDTWAEVWDRVENHLKTDHPSKVEDGNTP